MINSIKKISFCFLLLMSCDNNLSKQNTYNITCLTNKNILDKNTIIDNLNELKCEYYLAYNEVCSLNTPSDLNTSVFRLIIAPELRTNYILVVETNKICSQIKIKRFKNTFNLFEYYQSTNKIINYEYCHKSISLEKNNIFFSKLNSINTSPYKAQRPVILNGTRLIFEWYNQGKYEIFTIYELDDAIQEVVDFLLEEIDNCFKE